jgi:hypothetical protein
MSGEMYMVEPVTLQDTGRTSAWKSLQEYRDFNSAADIAKYSTANLSVRPQSASDSLSVQTPPMAYNFFTELPPGEQPSASSQPMFPIPTGEGGTSQSSQTGAMSSVEAMAYRDMMRAYAPA